MATNNIKHKINHFKKNDRAWVFTLFGTAIGSGILFLPVQAGIAGILIVLTSMLFAFIVTYFAQKYYTLILAKSENADSYNSAIKEYWGNSAASIISILFSLQLFGYLLIYSTALNTDVGEFLYAYGITTNNLSNNPFCSLIILTVFTFFMIISEKKLIVLLAKITFLLIILLFFVSILFIPFWTLNSSILTAPLNLAHTFKNTLLCFPLFMGALIFYGALSPMVMYYKKNYTELSENDQVRKVLSINKVALSILSIFTIVFVISSALTLTPEGINYAIKNNISSLAVLGLGEKITLSLRCIRFLSYIVIFLALTTSFYGIALGLIELLSHQIPFPAHWNTENKRRITAIATMIIIWFFTYLNYNVIKIMGYFSTPFNGFILFIVPTLIIITSKKLKNYRGLTVSFILGVGLFTMISFFWGSIL